MEKLKIYFEIKKGTVNKNISFFTTKESLNTDVNYWIWVHKRNGWNIKYLGYKGVK